MKLFTAAIAPFALLTMCAPPAEPSFDHLPCNQWADEALDAGWTPADLEQLLPIMWRESRCQPDAIRTNQRGAAVDVGLMQINQIHRPELAKRGFTHLDMTNPDANLWFARWLHNWHEDRGQCGWSPWRGRC